MYMTKHLSIVSDVITQPRNVQIGTTGDHSISFTWETPECGNVVEYEFELFGESKYALFELHRDTTRDTSVLVRNLLPGTRYNFRIRAIDLNKKKGTFTAQRVETSTEGRSKQWRSQGGGLRPKPRGSFAARM